MLLGHPEREREIVVLGIDLDIKTYQTGTGLPSVGYHEPCEAYQCREISSNMVDNNTELYS